MAGYSLRLDDDKYTHLKRKVDGLKGPSINEILNELVDRYLDEDDAQADLRAPLENKEEESLAEILAVGVSASLERNREWAREVIRRAQLRWPGGLLQRRMAHYAKEKIFLAEHFAAYLGPRIQRALLDRHVMLILDAGSTTLWFCRYFFDQVATIAQQEGSNTLTIVTNNIPVADAYVARRERGQFGDSKRVGCMLVGGDVDAKYACTVGRHAAEAIELFTHHDFRKPTLYISLASANLMTLHEGTPTLLVRGDGQREVKRKILMSGEERFVISPLGKILNAAGPTPVNSALRYTGTESYFPVTDPGEIRDFTLVTTAREDKDSLLLHHSDNVREALKAQSTFPDTNTARQRHVALPFDAHVRKLARNKELEVEVPHEAMRVKVFLRFLALAE